MSKYLIGLDDGHGMETAGKRTCKLKEDLKFRGKTFKKGSIIHENDFNENLMELVEKGLDRCGIGHMQLAPGDSDISLQNRVKTANAKKCDLVVSFHANALVGTEWQTKAYGLVVIHTANCSAKSKTLAKNCYNHLSKDVKWYSNGATKYGVRADKDISGHTLYILRNTNMPSVLIEYGFMDNWEDVKMMCSETFQRGCAEATVQGICETLGVKYVAPKGEATQEKPNTAPTKTQYLKVLSSEPLNIRKVADWRADPCGTVKKGEVFTIVDKVTAKNGSTPMYKLKSGVYITSSTKYVETYYK